MITVNDSVLVLIDIQEKLVNMLNKPEPVVETTSKLLAAANIMEIPVVLTEQYPQGLGQTVLPLNEGNMVVEKTSFSAVQEPDFISKLKELNCKNVILGGIETHICVYQTAIELMENGFNVVVAKDACASRSKDCFKVGLSLMEKGGALVSNVETILFELLRGSKNPCFKQVQALIK